jgi:hypothetical protein
MTKNLTPGPWTVERPTSDDLACLPLEDKLVRGYREEGFIYVIEFSFGVIKVGQTKNARSRARQHLAQARNFGGHITRLWMSEAHPDWGENEGRLIAACRQVGEWTSYEYFSNLDYDSVVAYAVELAERSKPSPTPIFPAYEYEAFDEWCRANGALALVASGDAA